MFDCRKDIFFVKGEKEQKQKKAPLENGTFRGLNKKDD
jgi:hypothetical protein